MNTIITSTRYIYSQTHTTRAFSWNICLY